MKSAIKIYVSLFSATWVLDMFINIRLILAQLWTFGMSVIKLPVTLRRQMYNNFRHSKALCRVMVFNWQKIAFYLGKIEERHDVSQKQKKDKKVTSSKTWKRIKSHTEASNLFHWTSFEVCFTWEYLKHKYIFFLWKQ